MNNTSSETFVSFGRVRAVASGFGVLGMLFSLLAGQAMAQERLPWEKKRYGLEPPPAAAPAPRARISRDHRPENPYASGGSYRPTPRARPDSPPARYKPQVPADRSYSPPAKQRLHTSPQPYSRDRYSDGDNVRARKNDAYRPPRYRSNEYDGRAELAPRSRRWERRANYTYSENEILNAGHGFFGSISKNLARAIAYAFRSSGKPNGFILGEDAGGAFIAGLRYGEGRLHTKRGRSIKVFWQGPTLGYDFGGEGSRTMILVYNLNRTSDIFNRFSGIQGSAYVVGGVGLQLLKHNDITLAPIRSGVGLRLGANIGYLKYTRRPTWNPF